MLRFLAALVLVLFVPLAVAWAVGGAGQLVLVMVVEALLAGAALEAIDRGRRRSAAFRGVSAGPG